MTDKVLVLMRTFLHQRVFQRYASLIAASKMDVLSPKRQFYRRQLPDSCISFASPKGKKLFIESMSSGHMECYFKLAAQFRTQEEPAFCGLTTLVMILNALEIDPGKVWKGPWRWYHENMLDCCVPLQLIEKDGITFDQFLCLAKCNGVGTVAVRADERSSEEEFREKVREYTKRDDSFLILTYSRKVLKQTGDGHFSPVGGYHPEEDMVLMLDTARFKYPPHWIPLPLLFEAMKALDRSTGDPRGYVTMSRLDQNPSLILFRISTLFSVSFPCGCASDMVMFVQHWDDWLSQENTSKNLANTPELEEFVRGAVQALETGLQHLKSDQTILTTQLDLCCPADYLTQQHKCSIHKVLIGIEELQLFDLLSKILDERSLTYVNKMGEIANASADCERPAKVKCDLFNKITPAHFVVVFLLCWPYSAFNGFKEGTNRSILNTLFADLNASMTAKFLVSELMLLRKQLDLLMSLYYSKVKQTKCKCKKADRTN